MLENIEKEGDRGLPHDHNKMITYFDVLHATEQPSEGIWRVKNVWNFVVRVCNKADW